jgi:hypothetical protein
MYRDTLHSRYTVQSQIYEDVNIYADNRNLGIHVQHNKYRYMDKCKQDLRVIELHQHICQKLLVYCYK